MLIKKLINIINKLYIKSEKFKNQWNIKLKLTQ